MSLLVKAQREGSTIARVTPESAGWRYVGFAAHRLSEGEALDVHEAAREVCIVVLSGTVTIEADGQRFSSIGTRSSVFEDTSPYALYLPPANARRCAPNAARKSASQARRVRAATRCV